MRACVCLDVCVHMDGEALYHPVQCWWGGDLDREVHMMKYDFTFQAMNHTLSSRCLHRLALACFINDLSVQMGPNADSEGKKLLILLFFWGFFTKKRSACLGEGWRWPSTVQCVFECVCVVRAVQCVRFLCV